MVGLKEIHELRRGLALRRQSRHATAMAELENMIPNPPAHPYRLGVQWERFCSMPCFGGGSAGLPATAPAAEYLFRLTSLSRLAQDTTWAFFRPDFPNLASISAPNARLMEQLVRRRMRDGWLRLAAYATGDFSSRRGFTWWTNHAYEPASILKGAHRCGMLDEWVLPFSVLLRCRSLAVGARRLLRVPTALDGFDSPIFHPTSDEDRPRAGVTIDLSAPVLKGGADEFILPPLNVDLIEVWPLQVTDDMKAPSEVREGSKLYGRLASYYQSL